jgi:hypothetical protein
LKIRGTFRLLSIMLASVAPAPVAGSDIAFAPEYHFYQDIHAFLAQKDSLFRQRYFLEWTSGAHVAFFSVNDRFFLFGDMSANVGLGKQDRNIVSDPREIDAAFGLTGEYRRQGLFFGAGIDHRCFHQIDREEWETTYYNRLFASVSSPHFRLPFFRSRLSGTESLAFKDRCAWQAEISGYPYGFFGILDTSTIEWNNEYVADISAGARCAVYRYRWVAAVIVAGAGAYFTREGGVRSTFEAGAEALCTRGRFGMSVYLRWQALDQRSIRLNKGGLVSVGISAFN